VGIAGDATFSGGTFTVNGSGTDMWDTADAFQFAYRPLTGNGQITARVVTVQAADTWAKAGVMIRETLNADSTHAMLAVTPGNGVSFQWRSATAGSSSYLPGTNAAPYWVTLVRSGNTLTASMSTDGTNWVQVGSTTIPMAVNVFVGLAVTAHNNGTVNTSTFDGVQVPPSAPTNLRVK
jgi:regulation of enolase protein 1 (concanavalin A-like superfamily)